MIRVVLVDDETLLCESLKVSIQQDSEIEVVGIATNGFEALKLCDEELPDLVIMDLEMPECDGVKGTKLIKKKHPNIKVVILTTFNDDQNVSQVFKNGANGYILKSIKASELGEALKSVVRGLNVIKDDIFDILIKQLESNLTYESFENNELDTDLNDREIKIIQRIIQGQSNKQIASNIGLSEGRIKNIISGIYIKLKVQDRVQLAVVAVKYHLC